MPYRGHFLYANVASTTTRADELGATEPLPLPHDGRMEEVVYTTYFSKERRVCHLLIKMELVKHLHATLNLNNSHTHHQLVEYIIYIYFGCYYILQHQVKWDTFIKVICVHAMSADCYFSGKNVFVN